MRRLVLSLILTIPSALYLGYALPLTAGAGEPASPGDTLATSEGNLLIRTINHATLALQWKGLTICVDPVGGAARFEGLPRPDLILITDVHGDHLDLGTLKVLIDPKTRIVASPSVAEKLPEELKDKLTVLANQAKETVAGIQIEAVPAYNLAADRQKFHAKGRGNGYFLALGGKRVYLSGDTEDIPEMRALKNIDLAFLCMNLPYTMTVDQAASAVREFRPKVVYPYHCRGSDLEQFKKLVGSDVGVEVRIRDWYKP